MKNIPVDESKKVIARIMMGVVAYIVIGGKIVEVRHLLMVISKKKIQDQARRVFHMVEEMGGTATWDFKESVTHYIFGISNCLKVITHKKEGKPNRSKESQKAQSKCKLVSPLWIEQVYNS